MWWYAFMCEVDVVSLRDTNVTAMATIRTRKGIRDNYLDPATGEITFKSQEEWVHLVKDNKRFFTMHEAIINLLPLLDGSELKVFIWCGMQANLNDNKLPLVREYRQQMAKETGVGERTVDNAIGSLTKKGIFLRTGTSSYHINPHLLWKGNKVGRAKNVEAFEQLKKGGPVTEKGA